MDSLTKQSQSEILIIDIDRDAVRKIRVRISYDGQIFSIDHAIVVCMPDFEPACFVLVRAKVIDRGRCRFIIGLEDAVNRISKKGGYGVVLLRYNEVLNTLVIDSKVLRCRIARCSCYPVAIGAEINAAPECNLVAHHLAILI